MGWTSVSSSAAKPAAVLINAARGGVVDEAALTEALQAVGARRLARDAASTRLAAVEAAQTPAQRVEATDDPQLRRILPRIDDPAMAEAFEARYQDTLTRLRSGITVQEGQIASLQRSLTDFESQTAKQGEDLIKLQQLMREAEASRLLYEYFLRRLNETSAQQGVQQADSRIISDAVAPRLPAKPRKSLILMMSLILGAVLGAAFVLIREFRKSGVMTAEALEALTQYPVMGQIPLLPNRVRKDGVTYLRDRPTSAAAEAVRNLRTSLMLSSIDCPPQVIMTNSAIPGEGKTTVSMALAMNFGMLGKKTLLIEGDIRRRIFGEYLDAGQKDGIVAVLSGQRSFEEVVVRENLLGVDVLLADKAGSVNAADIFTSERFAELMRELRTSYDAIIIDTPPVLIVPDARVIAQHVDSILFVVGWDSTERSQIVNALREFESVGKPVSGLALNKISPRTMKRYGYGGYGAYSHYNSDYYQN